ncbi:hypothetical protein GUJ93_ZPchr0013g34355 [Zizania palustris]|uniref:Uncharacterized protein n=1 Tax=Zizania palustris TaxID=103762 RepID=A0A8J6BXC6_ZIZPA|nr:hypothetical protein GUJ93_ZPchr0013g34355 [Zizania palustris]
MQSQTQEDFEAYMTQLPKMRDFGLEAFQEQRAAAPFNGGPSDVEGSDSDSSSMQQQQYQVDFEVYMTQLPKVEDLGLEAFQELPLSVLDKVDRGISI